MANTTGKSNYKITPFWQGHANVDPATAEIGKRLGSQHARADAAFRKNFPDHAGELVLQFSYNKEPFIKRLVAQVVTVAGDILYIEYPGDPNDTDKMLQWWKNLINLGVDHGGIQGTWLEVFRTDANGQPAIIKDPKRVDSNGKPIMQLICRELTYNAASDKKPENDCSLECFQKCGLLRETVIPANKKRGRKEATKQYDLPWHLNGGPQIAPIGNARLLAHNPDVERDFKYCDAFLEAALAKMKNNLHRINLAIEQAKKGKVNPPPTQIINDGNYDIAELLAMTADTHKQLEAKLRDRYLYLFQNGIGVIDTALADLKIARNLMAKGASSEMMAYVCFQIIWGGAFMLIDNRMSLLKIWENALVSYGTFEDDPFLDVSNSLYNAYMLLGEAEMLLWPYAQNIGRVFGAKIQQIDWWDFFLEHFSKNDSMMNQIRDLRATHDAQAALSNLSEKFRELHAALDIAEAKLGADERASVDRQAASALRDRELAELAKASQESSDDEDEDTLGEGKLVQPSVAAAGGSQYEEEDKKSGDRVIFASFNRRSEKEEKATRRSSGSKSAAAAGSAEYSSVRTKKSAQKIHDIPTADQLSFIYKNLNNDNRKRFKILFGLERGPLKLEEVLTLADQLDKISHGKEINIRNDFFLKLNKHKHPQHAPGKVQQSLAKDFLDRLRPFFIIYGYFPQEGFVDEAGKAVDWESSSSKECNAVDKFFKRQLAQKLFLQR